MSLIINLPIWFQWNDGRFFPKINQSYLQIIESCLHSMMAEDKKKNLEGLYKHLSKVAPHRIELIIRSPETYYFILNSVFGGRKPNLEFLTDTFTAEYFLANNEFPDFISKTNSQKELYWTSLGDYTIEFDSSRIQAYGHLYKGIFIDGAGKYNSFHHKTENETFTDFNEPELGKIHNKIVKTINSIKLNSPVAAGCLTSSVCSVSMQKSISSNSFYSGSRQALIGKIGLVNPQSGTIHDLMNSLIHEAVHSFLYKIELLEPFYIEEQNLTKIKIKSPWTQNLLPVHSYTHACFVWFALAAFWDKFEKKQGIKDTKYLTRALSGFTGDDLAVPVKKFVNEKVISAINSMQNQIINSR